MASMVGTPSHALVEGVRLAAAEIKCFRTSINLLIVGISLRAVLPTGGTYASIAGNAVAARPSTSPPPAAEPRASAECGDH